MSRFVLFSKLEEAEAEQRRKLRAVQLAEAKVLALARREGPLSKAQKRNLRKKMKRAAQKTSTSPVVVSTLPLPPSISVDVSPVDVDAPVESPSPTVVPVTLVSRRTEALVSRTEALSVCLPISMEGPLTAAQKRNLRRRLTRAAKKKQIQQAQVQTHDAKQPAGSSPVVVETTTVVPVVDVDVHAKCPTATEVVPVVHTFSSDGVERLQFVPFDVLIACIMPFLEAESIARFSSTCKRYHQTCQAGQLWKQQFCQKYPRSVLTPQSLDDWQAAFLLEKQQVSSRFVCFHSGANFTTAVLGLPVAYSVNPKKRCVDYVRPAFSLLSTAAAASGVTRTPEGDEVQLVLPLYFSQSHFQRGLPALKQVLVKLSPQRGTHLFHKDMVLEVMPKILNTLIVLLADKGISSGTRVLQTYMWLHRLFLALVREFNLQDEVEDRLHWFISNAEARHKEHCPSLGDLIPLLLVSNTYSWRDLAGPYFTESMTRNVLWTCKAYPSLAQIRGVDDPERLTKTFEATKVGLRLCMLNVLFLRSLAKGNTHTRARQYDVFATAAELEGQFDAKLSNESLTGQISRILSVADFPVVFRFLGLKLPSRAKFIAMLHSFVTKSLKAGYHSKHTNFSRIHASGTSRVLKSGESYNTQGLSELSFVDEWSWQGGTKYLDASCLLYDAKHVLLETLDYCHTRCQLAHGAITHSGDIIRGQDGKHVMELNLAKLPARVTTLVFVLSAFAGATLLDIERPTVRFSNRLTGEELCSYSTTARNTGRLSAIIMCRLSRSSNGQWHVQALGDLSEGDASQYTGIHQTIARLW